MSEVIEIVILTFVVWIGLLGVVGPRAKRRRKKEEAWRRMTATWS